ncbi:hypothetical protein MBLNU230_g8391t1 [Neophaeotheca triangularis]
MSASKRLRQRQEDATRAASPQSANKRLKTTKATHVPAAKSGLDFLVDENARDGRKLGAKLTNGAPRKNTTQVNESNAIVAPNTAQVEANETQPEVIDISSGEEESSELEESEDHADEGAQAEGPTSQQKPSINGHISPVSDEQEGSGHGDVEMGGMGDDNGDTGEEPSLGDMLLARHPEPINVADSFQDPFAESKAMVPSAGKALAVPSGNSLGTVLTQALRTNDKDLLESCFQTNDKASIRATVQRLQSQHVASLLTRLAERIHKRPGRTGNLLVWIQWCLVAHGGYLSSQPDVLKQLASLQSVIRERANGLQPLLHVKGKLDMLSAQLELRRDLHQSSRASNGEEDEDDAVIYVEGQDDDWSSSEGEERDEETSARAIAPPSTSKKGRKPPTFVSGNASASEGSDDEQMPTTNGVSHHDQDEDSGSEEEDQDGMLDVEAEETDDDDAEEDSEDDADDQEASEEEDMSEDESEEEAQPAKPAKLNRKR